MTKLSGKVLLLFSSKLDFNSLLNLKEFTSQNKLISEIQKLEDFTLYTTIHKFSKLLNNCSIDLKVKLLEESITTPKNLRANYQKQIINKYSIFIQYINEPLTDIKNTLKIFEKNKKSKANIALQNFEFKGPDNSTEKVYVHFLYSSDSTSGGHNIVTKFLNVDSKIRIYKKTEMIWRDTTNYETSVYKDYLKKQLDDKLKPFTNNDVYGLVLLDGIFRLYDKTLKKDSRSENVDKSLEIRGKDCRRWNKNKLISIFNRENVTYKPVDNIVLDSCYRSVMIDYLNKNLPNNEYNSLDDTDLIQTVKWIKSGLKIQDMCTILKDHLYKNNKLIQI